MVLMAVLGCAAAPTSSATNAQPPPSPSAARAADGVTPSTERQPSAKDLPPALDGLDLGAEQRRSIVKLRDELRKELADTQLVARSVLRMVAPDVRRCRGDSPAMGLASERAIAAIYHARRIALNGLDKLHIILTPAQRYQLARQLLDMDDERAAEQPEPKRKSSRRKQNDRAVRSFTERLDLSVGQMVKVLLRLNAVRDDFEDQLDPWRMPYRNAVRAFVRDDFVARELALAKMPIAKMVLGSVRKALRVAVPLLEPNQCREAAAILEETADKPREDR